MRTYAEYLTTMTVKALNVIARDMGLKGYSKLRKAELIIMLDNAVAALVPVILNVEVAEHATQIREIIANAPVEPIVLSPVETPESDADGVEDLTYAYTCMRKTIRSMGNTPGRVRIVGRMRELSKALRGMGVDMRTV